MIHGLAEERKPMRVGLEHFFDAAHNCILAMTASMLNQAGPDSEDRSAVLLTYLFVF